MNKLLLILSFACAGSIGVGVYHRDATRAHSLALASARQRLDKTTHLEQTQARLAGLRADVQQKKSRLSDARPRHELSPELVQLLERTQPNPKPAALAELRQQLGIGWNCSPDYVLVSKSIIGQLDYLRLESGARPTDTACQLLGLSPAEQSSLAGALQRARDDWKAPAIERAEPHDDVVAQYAVRAPDAEAELSLSNRVAAEFVSVVGAERAEFLLPSAWSEFRNSLGSTEAETLIVRRKAETGGSDLVWEMKRGSQSSTGTVRYAYYPSSWFLTAFPDGWSALAAREGFELPAKFKSAAP